ncbi:MAG: flagellar motor protein MotB [Bacillota bacterium]
MPRRRKSNKDSGDDSNWMTTFSDMMTLLLTFFVLLYSMSTIDAEKFEAAISSLRENMGMLPGGRSVSDGELVDSGSLGSDISPSPRSNLTAVMAEMQQYVQEKQLEEEVNLEMTQRGLVVRFTGQILFDIGDAEIKGEGRDVLNKVAAELKDMPNNVMVEGHTDNWPIQTDEFPSNWELSTTRATEVIKYFIEDPGIDPERLSAAGYSKYRPLKENNSPENRALNRRVEVVILNTTNGQQNEQQSEQGGG